MHYFPVETGCAPDCASPAGTISDLTEGLEAVVRTASLTSIPDQVGTDSFEFEVCGEVAPKHH